MIDSQRFARLVTNAVVRRPVLWRVFRRPLTRMFDGLAATWNDRHVSGERVAALDAALDALTDEPKRILDLGTGTGAAARMLAARYPHAEVTGVDLSQPMIEVAQAHATSDRERYLVGDASALPFGDGSFDLVVQLNMIPFYDELARMVAPGGAVVLAYSRGAGTPIYTPFDRSRAELERRRFAGFEESAAGNGTALLARLHS